MKLPRLLVLMILLFAMLACQKVEDRVDAKEQAIDHLNQRRYDQAIELLLKILQEKPADSEIKVLLASAYSGSTGFNVIDSFEAFRPLLFRKTSLSPSHGLQTEEHAASASEGATDARMHALERASLRFLDSFTSTLRTIVHIPHTPLAARPRLVEALMLLSTVGTEDNSGVKARSYAALLNALQFINYTRDALPGLVVEDTNLSFVDAVCALDTHTFLENLEVSTTYLLNSVTDLNAAYKAQSRNLTPALVRIKEAAASVQTVYEQHKGTLNDADLAFSATKAAYCR